MSQAGQERAARVDGAEEFTGRSTGSRIAVLQKAADTLDAILGAGEGLTPTEVAAVIHTNRSTAFRLLTSLEQTGLLARDCATGRYRLGMKLLQYGAAVRAQMPIVTIAEPVLMNLRDQTRQTVILSIREGWGARCLLRLPGPEVDVVSWTTGQWVPLGVGAAPRALMSTLDDAELSRYLSDADDGTTQDPRPTHHQLRDELTHERTRGWVLSTDAASLGIASLGAVVRDRLGTSVCAISVAGLQHHYTGDNLARTVANITAATHAIRQQLNN